MSKRHWKYEELTCKALDTYDEISQFLQEPPPWRTLCRELTPHSNEAIRNIETNKYASPSLEKPETFCHFDSDAEEVERHDVKNIPKTLVCHDMANGYHDDSFIDGTSQYDAYTFYNWAGIEIFCYFSHHLITIPPLGWINVAHDHGVKVIGTVITEWAEGVMFWDKILDSKEEYQYFANALVAIAKTLKFDGWLLNIENKISKPDMLLRFVQYLHQSLHAELPNAVLVWYDSVTVTGTLNWQNGLNEKNKAFFDACDGLFTNYSWTVADVTASAQQAGDRLTDLYIGIDVWGRNFYGGGQFNVQEAVRVAHSHGCSLAIFAPAWTHEAIPTDQSDIYTITMAENLDKHEQFQLRDRALWDSLWPFLNTHLPNKLPFRTSFCRGQGKKRWMYGEVWCPGPWYNLRHMQYQPNAAHGPHGYILSTVENLNKISKDLYKDTKGIVRYRDSASSRNELHSVREATIVTDTSKGKLSEDGASNVINDEGTIAKIKKVAEDSPPQKLENDENVNDNTESEHTTGHSMVQMSVNIQLGKKAYKTKYDLASVPDELECLEQYYGDSFMGGSCLKINPSDKLNCEHRLIRLFQCDFYCEDSLIACVVTKTMREFSDQTLNIQLFMKNSLGEDLRVVLVGRELVNMPVQNSDSNPSGVIKVYPLNTSSGEFKEVQKYMMVNEAGFYVAVENSFDWNVRYFVVRARGGRVRSVAARAGGQRGAVLLGHFGLAAMPTL